MQLLVRNRVEDYAVWWSVTRAHSPAREAAGLHSASLWTNTDDPNEIFFVLDVDDRQRAELFMQTPDADAKAIEAGLLDGEYWFVDEPVTA